MVNDLINQSDTITSETEVIVSEPSVTPNLVDWLIHGSKKKYIRFTLATLSAIPWVGGFIGAIASLSGEYEQDKNNDFLRFWIQSHEVKIERLGKTLQEIFTRFDQLGDQIDERIQSEDYLSLVRSAFRQWDESETEEKRQLVKKLITQAGASPIFPDDLIRLFLKWIEDYHDSHFVVIKAIYSNPGITRGDMWDRAHTERPREDSAEADLFRYLIRDLSTGGVIRQARETDGDGRFIRQASAARGRSHNLSRTLESAFEDTKPYVLTELGKQFVHFVFDEVVVRIDQ
ncbi:MAG: hypothetical protein ABI425_01435 [Patescibacteria group bacterium]